VRRGLERPAGVEAAPAPQVLQRTGGGW
jgi:hypothetical protein